MLQLDAVQLYDLSEAGRMLYRDPARLAREARLRKIPSARADRKLGLPVPWVEAESGAGPADPEALKIYWLARLAPPSPDARRATRDRSRLPTEHLLAPEEAARRIFATAEALRRLDVEGTLPSLRVDGAVRYDAALTDLVAREADGEPNGEDLRTAADARRDEVRAWARFEYEDKPAPAPQPAFDAVRPAAPATPTERTTDATTDDGADAPAEDESPGAYEIPADLLGGIETPPSRLIEVDGFETIDED